MEKQNIQRRSDNVAKIVCIIICVLLLPVLVVNTTLIVKGLIDKDTVPTFAGKAPLIVLSDSMAPKILSGDLIIINDVDTETLQTGDVISFFDPASKTNAVVTHRIIEVVDDDGEIYFRTQGDANNAVDRELVPAKNVVGIWSGKTYSGIGNVAIFIQSTPGLILCIGVPIILLLAFEMLGRRKSAAAANEENAALMAELEELRALKAAKEKEDAADSASVDNAE